MNSFSNSLHVMGVYKILNTINGKFYIGSSIDVCKRVRKHIGLLRGNRHKNPHLQNDWNVYGEDKFEINIVEIVSDENMLRDREAYYINTTRCTDSAIGYNLSRRTNIGIGKYNSSDIRAKLSDACKGEKNGNFGRHHTDEELERIRNNRWGADYVKKPRKPYIRKSDEEIRLSRQRMSDRMKNRVVTEETRHKMSVYRTGKHHSEETKQKYREQRKGENNSNSKLNRSQVFEIYEKMHSGVNYKIVCAEYGVNPSLVYEIKRKEHWVFRNE